MPISVEDALKTRSFAKVSPLALSPDGGLLAYVVRDNQRMQTTGGEDDLPLRTGVPTTAKSGDIYLSNTKTRETTNLTEGTGSNFEPTWSPDGRYLAFLSDRISGQAALWVWERQANRLRRISDRPVRLAPLVNHIEWMPDSFHILVTVIPAGLSIDQYRARVSLSSALTDARSKPTWESTVVLYESNPAKMEPSSAASAAMLNLDATYLHDLVSFDVRDGTSEPIFTGRCVGWYSLAPNGRQLAIAIPKRLHQPGSFQRVYDIVVLDFPISGRPRTLVSDVLMSDGFSWCPDSSSLAYRAFDSEEKRYDYYVVDIGGSFAHRVSALPPHSYDGLTIPMWDEQGRNIYFLEDGELWRASIEKEKATRVAKIPNRLITQRISRKLGLLWSPDGGRSTIVIAHDDEHKEDGFYRVDLETGRNEALLERQQCYTCKWWVDVGRYVTTVALSNQELVFVAEDAASPPDLWVTDSDFKNVHQVTELNGHLGKQKLGTSRLVEWLSLEGDLTEGTLVLPPQFTPGRRYPVIVRVHPMPQSNHLNEFGFGDFPGPLDSQLFATRGYVVFLPDATLGQNRPMANLANSVLPGVNKLVELGIADPDRIGIIGFSIGGYSSLALVAQTTRFKAAVVAGGFGDFTASFGQMDPDGRGFWYALAERELGGSPWQYPLRYLVNSPLYYLDRIETPLLIVHGAEDSAASIFLANEIFVGLRRLNKQVEYAKYVGEPHVPADWSYANQRDVAERILAWFDSYLKSANR